MGTHLVSIYFELVKLSSEDGKTYSLNAMSGEEIWSQKAGGEVLNGLAIPEDFQEPRCAASTIHFMDELVMMEKMMADMFNDEEGVEQTDDFDVKKARANLNADPEEVASALKAEEAAKDK